jgi:hypothetical protein
LSTISVWKSMTSSALVRRLIERLSAIASPAPMPVAARWGAYRS